MVRELQNLKTALDDQMDADIDLLEGIPLAREERVIEQMS